MRRVAPAVLAVLLACTFLLPACSDDDPVTPEPFSVTLRVTDAEDNPVLGLYVTLVSDGPYLQDAAPRPQRAATRIPFVVPIACRALLTIEDIEGHHVRTLLDGPVEVSDHIATLRLFPVTEGNRCFLEWHAEFECPESKTADLPETVGESMFQAGFDALKKRYGQR